MPMRILLFYGSEEVENEVRGRSRSFPEHVVLCLIVLIDCILQ